MAIPSEPVLVVSAETHDRVTYFEQHRAHPDGEVFVAGNSPPQLAAQTPRLLDAIAAGYLRVVEAVEGELELLLGPPPPEQPEQPPPPPEVPEAPETPEPPEPPEDPELPSDDASDAPPTEPPHRGRGRPRRT
jgi:hypothetical protein